MPNTNPTIVSASLSDKELQDSINKMVANFDKGLQDMLDHTNKKVSEINEALKGIGKVNFGATSSNDGAVVKQTKAQNDFTDAVKKSTDEIKRQGKEAAMSFDNFSKAQQVAIRSANPSGMRNADTLQTMNIQLDLLRERLREARQQYSSFVALAAHATTTGDKGLFQYATDGVHRYEQEVRNLIPQIRTLQSGIQQMGDVIAPQGHTIQNYVNSLQKANPELAALNAQYKSGTSLLQDQNVSYSSATGAVSRYTEAIRKQAQAIRDSRDWQEKGRVVSGDTVFYDPERANVSKRDKQLLLSLEEQIVQAQQRETDEAQKSTQAAQQQTQAAKETAQAILSVSKALGITDEQMNKSAHVYLKERGISTRNVTAPNSSVFQSYDDLRSSIAAVLKVEASQVNMLNTLNASQSQLSASLKQLQGAYNKLGRADRESEQGKNLILTIQKTQRAIQKLQSEASRPIGLGNALALSEKTLDDMAYKLRQLQSYKMGLNVKTQVDEMKQVDKEIVSLKKRYDELMGKNQQMIASNTALGRSWNYMKNRLAFYFTVGASTSFVKQLIDIRGQYELLDRSIGILIDSAQNGSQIFAELNAMAIKSPFTTMELGAAAKQLVAYDVAAKDVVDTTRRLADMAAAVGIPIERLTYALGQIKAYGYLNARDARMFANAGIPLVKELADYYTELEGRLVSTADVYDRIKKKAIDYSDVMSVVNKMTDEGGKFFDFQEKAADTLKVRIANLTLAWNNMLNEMGKDNQGILTEGLKVTKQIFESWRDINNMVIALGLTYGTIKAAQIAYYLWVMRTEKAVGAWSKIISAIDYAFNAKIANVINSLKTSLVGFFTNPAAMLTVAFTALSVALTKAYLDYRDLQAANEEFNKSVVKNAEENVKSIDKFFGDYKKQLESVGSLNSADQTKLWERVQEEIEKTTKNAEKYIEILNKIPEVSKRIEVGESVLEQSKRIQDELKYMAERGMFNVGGGFANDSAAKDLQQYSDAVNELITKYGDLDNAKKEALKVNEITLESGETIRQYTGEYADFQRAQIEAEKELQNIVSTLDKVNMAEILGTGDMETQLANVRSFAVAWRDAFLATEKGSKISAEGQALLNSYIDKWIEQQARVNHLIKDENTAAVEANRTAWETFFKFLNTEERKRLDVAIKTNQLGSTAVQELWDEASKRMQKNATTSYNLIQEQIADLRNTPDIVINVVYRNNKEKLEEDQEEFEKKYIQPKDWGVLSTDEYLKQEKANREKYGTLMRKQGEDTVEYEKRISDERKTNLELQKRNGDIIEENKNKTDAYSQSVTEQARKEKKAADDRLKVIKEVEDAGGYDFSTKGERAAANKAAKQAESELAKALKDELSTIDKVRSIYKDLTKEGMSHANAVERATRGWNETVNAINRVLQKNGLQKLDLSKFAGIENPRELVNMLQSQLNTLLKRGAKPAEIKELQTKVNTLEVDADKYDLTKITKGLNNELGKLKDEYELAVELDANPELGDMFADMFGINTSTLPKTFGDALDRAQTIINRKLAEMNITTPFDLMEGNIDSFAKSTGLDKDGAVIKELVSAQNAYRDMFKKNITETEKMLDDYIKKYGDYSDKIAEIEAGRLEKLKKLNEAYYTEEMRKRPEYTAKLNAIEQGASKEKQQVNFDEFKNSRYYTMMFENLDYISTKTIRDMRDRVRELMDTMNDLTPEQLKTLISQYEKLEQKLVKRSPFKTLTKDLKEYFATTKERKAANIEFKNAQKEYDAQKKSVAALKEKYEQAKANSNTSQSYLNFLRIEIDGENEILKILKEQLEAAQKKADKYNLTAKLAKSEALAFANVVGQNLQSLGELRDFLQQDLGVELSDELNGLVDGLSKVGQGINKITSSATSGDVVGVITGVGQTVYGLYDGIASIFGGGGSSDKKITRQIQESENEVKRLELAYIDLEHAVNDAYGTSVIGAKNAAVANKELQLAELKRQLALEQSRDSKHRDEDRIAELQKQIKEAEYDIRDFKNSIVNDLLGISSVGDALENVMTKIIDTFRSGSYTLKDIMNDVKLSFDDMIANMVMKMYTTKVLEPWFEEQWQKIQDDITTRNKGSIDAMQNEIRHKSWISTLDAGDISEWLYDNDRNLFNDILSSLGQERLGDFESLYDRMVWFNNSWNTGLAQRIADEYAKRQDGLIKQFEKDSSRVEKGDIQKYAELLRNGQPIVEENLTEIESFLRELGLLNDKKQTSLSALQQGISQISETTAESLEAYMNGVSQQVYYHSSLLEQIRDSVVGLDLDASLGVQSQMLLQLQNSYQTQQAIQQILEGVLVPSGRAFAVELLS